jgi:hypothetical protein
MQRPPFEAIQPKAYNNQSFWMQAGGGEEQKTKQYHEKTREIWIASLLFLVDYYGEQSSRVVILGYDLQQCSNNNPSTITFIFVYQILHQTRL